LLSKRISEILKSVLLCSLFFGENWASTVVSADRFLLKIIDQTVSFQDFKYQSRNLKTLNCVYDDSFVVQYFQKAFIGEWLEFLEKFPVKAKEASEYMHKNSELMKKIRHFYKALRYADDQKMLVTPDLSNLIREATQENNCDLEVLHKDTLKTNFTALIRMELYFRSRYSGQLQSGSLSFETVRPSIDLFIESLDKQFPHEYYW
jgi:hypothetical protein